jgi:hypothetical protein
VAAIPIITGAAAKAAAARGTAAVPVRIGTAAASSKGMIVVYAFCGRLTLICIIFKSVF